MAMKLFVVAMRKGLAEGLNADTLPHIELENNARTTDDENFIVKDVIC
jgi:hypothetical protein